MLYEIGDYIQNVSKDNITCTCRFSSIFPNNYKNGDKICKHIKKVLSLLNDANNLKSSN